MNDWNEVDRTLLEWAASGPVEVREDGRWLAGLSASNCELRRNGRTVLVHLWSNERNLTRRVLAVKARSDERLVLEVQRFGRAKPASLEFVRVDLPRPQGRITREEFRDRFARFLAENFPDSIVDSLTVSADLEHSFSGVYVRGRMHEGPREHAVISVSSSGNSSPVEDILTFGVLWLDWTRQHAVNRAVEGLRVFVPEGSSRFLRERASALTPGVGLEIFEFNLEKSRARKIDLADAGNLADRLISRVEAEFSVSAAKEAISRIQSLAPQDSKSPFNITVRLTAAPDETALCFRGLEFAHYTREGLAFGLGELREPLTERTRPRLVRLIRELLLHRTPLAKETTHPLYRAAPERWLGSIILDDPSRIDARLDSRYIYSEVPAVSGRERGVLDILGVTLEGRLVVIELKASEDIHLPMQAVDYWLRVRRHQRNGEFQRQGYFVAREISSDPPLVWLVAPALRFHPAMDTLQKYLAPEISVIRIGVNECWRQKLKVVLRQ